MQGKGNLFYWQCKTCRLLKRNATHTFRFDHDQHKCLNLPFCAKCKRPVRPNINLKMDMDWLETRTTRQSEAFQAWFEPRRTRSMTVLEIGAGPVQPLARAIGEDLVKTDKFRCALVRINIVKERKS